MQGLFRLPAMHNSVIVTLQCEQTKLMWRRTILSFSENSCCPAANGRTTSGPDLGHRHDKINTNDSIFIKD